MGVKEEAMNIPQHHLSTVADLGGIQGCARTPLWTLVIIGASLSEPHTSVTSLRTRVCIYLCLLARLLAWTDHLPEILNKRV